MGYKKIDKKTINSQAAFCNELMDRLSTLVKESVTIEREYYYYGGVQNHYRIKQDIIRLRRELQQLSKLVTPEWEN